VDSVSEEAMERLTAEELLALVQRVFAPRKSDRALAFLVDLPDGADDDNPAWKTRRELALDWAGALVTVKDRLRMSVHLYLYRNVGRNNADLPAGAWAHRFGPLPDTHSGLEPDRQESFESIFATHDIIIAPTQFSATAPLKNAARAHGFRAATMPGFSPEMIPALRLDYVEINRKVAKLKALLDRAATARIKLVVDSKDEHRLVLDLRHRTAHASGGLFPESGTAGNLPSGEAYIVPYEGELQGDPTRSCGSLPVQFGDEVVVYRIESNRAIAVEGKGEVSRREAALLAAEPAYGNIAELGLGVLSEFGVKPCGDLLLDEKLGLHLAFGRSEHFGGQVGPGQFSSPEAVVHIDRVFIKETQPRVHVARLVLEFEDGSAMDLMVDGRYAWGE